MKIASHKHNLMTSSSVGSGHPGKYSNKLPHEYFSVFHKFYMVILEYFVPYVAIFSRQPYFWTSYFFTLLLSDNLNATITFSEKLFLQGS